MELLIKRTIKIVFVVLILFTFVAIGVFSHSGRTDKFGGHNNRKTGGYHYHNAGSVHAAGNPYQDHTTCGICPSSKKKAKSDSKVELTEKDKIIALQMGLKCMGYDIGNVDGKMNILTEKATSLVVKEYYSTQKQRN